MAPQLNVTRNPYSQKGREFMAQFMDSTKTPAHELVSFAQREETMHKELLDGNIPPSLLTLCPVPVSCTGHTGVLWVSADYLAIGDDDDYVLTPLAPLTGQDIADRLGCLLPTRKMVDAIYHAADVKLEALPWGPPYDATMQWTYRYVGQSDKISAQLKAHGATLGQLVAGHKKDVVVTNHMEDPRHHVAIYGWFQKNGVAIQTPVQPKAHEITYADYSHGLRLIFGTMQVDGSDMAVKDVLKDPNLCAMISDEGPVLNPHY